MPLLAVTRDLSPSFEQCQLTHLARQPIDLARARTQHEAYERCLASLGCRVGGCRSDDLPDSVFVEDC